MRCCGWGGGRGSRRSCSAFTHRCATVFHAEFAEGRGVRGGGIRELPPRPSCLHRSLHHAFGARNTRGTRSRGGLLSGSRPRPQPGPSLHPRSTKQGLGVGSALRLASECRSLDCALRAPLGMTAPARPRAPRTRAPASAHPHPRTRAPARRSRRRTAACLAATAGPAASCSRSRCSTRAAARRSTESVRPEMPPRRRTGRAGAGACRRSRAVRA